MNINSTLENKLNEVFNESAAIVCSDEYLTMVNNIVNAEPGDSWFIQSTCLVFGEIESIFMDKDNFKYEMKLYNYNNLVNQWERLKYNTELYKQALYKAIEFVTHGKAFIYTLANNTAIAIINVGPDNYIVVPGSEIGPIVRSLYGDLPKHTIPTVITTPYPNTPGPITNEDEDNSTDKPNVDEDVDEVEKDVRIDLDTDSFNKQLKGMREKIDVFKCKINKDIGQTTIVLGTPKHYTDNTIQTTAPFETIGCILFNKFKDNNVAVTGMLRSIERGNESSAVKRAVYFKTNGDLVGALITISYIKQGKPAELIAYLTGHTLRRYYQMSRIPEAVYYDVV